MGAELRIESEYDLAWKIHGDDHRHAVAARDHFRTQIELRLGPEVASQIQWHVDAAMRRFLADDVPDLDLAAERTFYQLLALERAVIEIEGRIEAGNSFFDPYHVNGLLPTLGLSWWEDVAPLLDGHENPGYLRPESVVTFLVMVRDADQRLPFGEGNEGKADHFPRDRRELIEFLERAVRLREAVWCNL
jgi:hypothetical protein